MGDVLLEVALRKILIVEGKNRGGRRDADVISASSGERAYEETCASLFTPKAGEEQGWRCG